MLLRGATGGSRRARDTAQRRRTALASVSAGLTAALVLVGTVPAIAAEGDRSEAEGRFLGGGSALVDLDAIAALDGY